MNETTKIYEPLWIVKLFHLFPHLNMWFQQVNSTFDPYNPEYLETILFWSTIPILFLILLLLILILYACFLVCASTNSTNSSNKNHKLAKQKQHQNNNNNNNHHHHLHNHLNSNKKILKHKISLCRYKAFLISSIVLLSTSLGFIVYGSEAFHYSYQELNSNINNFSYQFDKITHDTLKIKDFIVNDLNTSLNQIINELNKQLNDAPQLNKAKTEIDLIRTTLNESLYELGSLNQLLYERYLYKNILKEIDYVEQIRWSVMIGIAIINLFLIILLIIGLSKNSKGSLCFFAFIGVIALITIWIINALYLGLTVFLSDFCVSPDEYTLDIANHNNMLPMVKFFIKCPLNQHYSPFQQNFNTIQRKFNTVHIIFKDNVVSLSSKRIDWNNNNFTKLVELSNKMLTQTFQSIKCDQTSFNYKNIVRTLCFNSIFGLAIVLISGLVFGLILPVLICVIPQIWKRIHNIYFDQTEEAHPFIPVQTRTNISAARQYNESPNFQRLNSSNNHHHNDIHTDPYLKSSSEASTNYNPYQLNNNNNYSNLNPPIGSSHNTGAIVCQPFYTQQTGTQTRRTTTLM